VTEVREEKAARRAFAQSIPPATAEESDRVAACVLEVLRRQDWRVVLTYLAMPGEVDLHALQRVPGLSLMVTRTPRDGPLTMHQLTGKLERHPFGYLQPHEGSPQIDPGSLDVVLVPGVLFAVDGGRLGHGRGYYDALLSSLHPRPYLIGATLDRRVVDKLPMIDTDVYVDAIATESGFREAVACAPS
jgi:5-formyltetrahydrofolate cyclo-ligase